MSDTVSVAGARSGGGGSDSTGPVPDRSERSSLTAHTDSLTSYGTTATSSASHTEVDTDSIDERSQSAKVDDEEQALLATTPPSVAETPPTGTVLSFKKLLWIITPMLLGTRLDSHL